MCVPVTSCVFLLSILSTTNVIHGAKILFYAPQIGDSHSTFLGRIADALVDAGHDVLFYAPNIDPRLTLIGTEKARVLHMPQPFALPADDFNEYQKRIWEDRSNDLLQAYRLMRRISVNSEVYCRAQLDNEKIMTELRLTKFDLGISETLDTCGFGLFQLLGIEKTIAASAISLPSHLAYLMGLSSPPSFVTDAILGKMGNSPTFFERFENTLNYFLSVYMQIQSLKRVTELFRERHGKDFADIEETIAQSALVFINMNEFVDFPRPITPKFIFVGGIGIRSPRTLTAEYTAIADSPSADGIVLVSFGTMIESRRMPDNIKETMLATFARFPRIHFIWKYEDIDGIANAPKNVIFATRIPQVDLLADSRVLGFISHGGLNGMMEAIASSVPMVCIPVFGDQMRNAHMAERHGVVRVISRFNITEESLHEALEAILYNSRDIFSLRAASRRLKAMLDDRPMNVRDRVLQYTEFVLKHGRLTELDCAGRSMTFFVYYNLDVIFAFVFGIIFLVLLSFTIIRYLFARSAMFAKKTKCE